MAAYLLVFILAVGIPFLLYCLWNFARDLKPHKPAAPVSLHMTSTNGTTTIPQSRAGNLPRIVALRDESRAAS